MKQLTWEVNSVPEWLIKEYLIELGGQESGLGLVSGPGWNAAYRKIENFKLGSISVGRVRLEISGDESALELFIPRLEQKLRRGGG